jgi:hypothetical protein
VKRKTDDEARWAAQAWGKMIAIQSVEFAKSRTLDSNRHSHPKLGSEKPQATTLNQVTNALLNKGLSSG